MHNSSLFPDSSDTDSDILFGRSINQSLGGNLHDLSDKLISKLIHLKFDDNPINLIRQISKDLTTKEREAILLRREKFAREQLLLKLLSEYGNLSSLEIDQKLNTLKIDNNVDNVLYDMIGDAMVDRLDVPTVHLRETPPSASSLYNTALVTATATKNNIDTQKRSNIRQRSTSGAESTFSSSWLSNWFKQETADQVSGGSRLHSKSFGILIPFGSSTSLISTYNSNNNIIINNDNNNNNNNTRHDTHQDGSYNLNENTANINDSDQKEPVELESICIKPDTSTPVTTGVDKYGFYNDINNTRPKNVVDEGVEDFYIHKNELLQLFEAGDNKQLGGAKKLLDSDILINGPQNSNSKAFTLVGTNDLEVSGTYTSSNIGTIDTLKEISKMHDQKNKQYEDQWDGFFKSLLRDYYKYNNSNSMSSEPLEKDVNNAFNALYSSANELFGIRGLNLVKLDKLIHKQFMPQNAHSHVVDQNVTYLRKLHKLINKIGIPAQYRSQLWFELSGAKNLKVPGEFDRLYNLAMVNSTAGDGVDPLILANINQVNLDLHRTMPSNIYFNDVINSQPGPNYYRLQKILYAFVVYKPSIGYCQGMNKIISNLLLGVVDKNTRLAEDDIFWIFVGFIDELLPTYSLKDYNFFDNRSLKYIGIDQRILLEKMFPKFMPKISQHFINIGVQIEYITLNWWILIFTENCLPIEIWIKFFDNLLVSKVELKFFSMLLALFKNFEKLLLRMENPDDVYLAMKNLNQNSSTKSNLKYSELMIISRGFEKKFDFDLPKLRQELS